MKKIIALILVAILVFSLFSCGASTAKTSPSAAASPTTDVPSSTPGTAPSASNGESSSASTSTAPDKNNIGYWTDSVDPFARKTYHVEFVYQMDLPIITNLGNALTKAGKKLNYTLTIANGKNDADSFMNTLATIIDKVPDGIFMQPVFDVVPRACEIVNEAKIPLIIPLVANLDKDGRNLVPCVNVNGSDAGTKMTDWLLDNYKSTFGDVKVSDIGFIVATISLLADVDARAQGAKAEFLKRNPGLDKNIFTLDMLGTNFTPEEAYDKAAAILAAHPDINYWLVISAGEEWGIGTARAAESAGKQKNMIVGTIQNDYAFGGTWDDPSNTPEWKATVPMYMPAFAAPMAAGLVALMDHRATPETLWLKDRAPGDFATYLTIPTEVVTRDTYKAYIAKYDAILN